MEYLVLTKDQCYAPFDRFLRTVFELTHPEYFKGIPKANLAERQRNIVFYKDKIGISFWALREIWRYYRDELDCMDEEVLKIFYQCSPTIGLDDDSYVVAFEDDKWWIDINKFDYSHDIKEEN